LEKKSMFLHGKKISYIEEGSTSAPTVLLLHGVPESSLIWREIIPVIVACGFRTIAPDLPGFGTSDKFDEPSTWDRYQQFVSDFTAEMKLETFHLVVHDWGGLIGLSWACDHVDRILSLVISDTILSKEYKWHKLAQIWRTPGLGEETMKGMADWPQFQKGMKQLMPMADADTLKDFFQVFRTPES
jgi:haloalkane dehalogenase